MLLVRPFRLRTIPGISQVHPVTLCSNLHRGHPSRDIPICQRESSRRASTLASAVLYHNSLQCPGDLFPTESSDLTRFGICSTSLVSTAEVRSTYRYDRIFVYNEDKPFSTLPSICLGERAPTSLYYCPDMGTACCY